MANAPLSLLTPPSAREERSGGLVCYLMIQRGLESMGLGETPKSTVCKENSSGDLEQRGDRSQEPLKEFKEYSIPQETEASRTTQSC